MKKARLITSSASRLRATWPVDAPFIARVNPRTAQPWGVNKDTSGVLLEPVKMRMPGMDGLTAIQHLSVEQPAIAVVILTTFNEDELMMRGLRAGAKGFLLKDTDRETLFETIRAAARGETLLRPDILARLLAFSAPVAPAGESGPRRTVEGAGLSDREREVLVGVAQGERSKEIAARLGISERTVKAHLDSIFNKLGGDSRAAAVSVALQRGLII